MLIRCLRTHALLSLQSNFPEIDSLPREYFSILWAVSANELPPFIYHNPIRRIIRVFLVLSLVCVAAGIPALFGVIHLNGPDTRNGALATTCLVVTAISLPGAVAMLLSALLTIPNARKADRCFESFRQHDCLVDWTYSDSEWRRFMLSEKKRLQKAGWVWSGFVGVILLAVWLVIAWSANSQWHGRMIGMFLGAAAALAVTAIILACNRLYIFTRWRRLSSCPRAFLGRNAIFCGGDIGKTRIHPAKEPWQCLHKLYSFAAFVFLFIKQ